MKIEVDVQGSPSLMVFVVFVDVKRRLKKKKYGIFRAQELCESRGGHPVLPVPNSRYGICERKATSKKRSPSTCHFDSQQLSDVLTLSVRCNLLQRMHSLTWHIGEGPIFFILLCELFVILGPDDN